jgi:hypothetical protein
MIWVSDATCYASLVLFVVSCFKNARPWLLVGTIDSHIRMLLPLLSTVSALSIQSPLSQLKIITMPIARWALEIAPRIRIRLRRMTTHSWSTTTTAAAITAVIPSTLR